MIILPNAEYNNEKNEKITTYQFLASVGCPVFESILLDENEELTIEKLKQIKEILKSEYCTVRYQYTKPTNNPIKGGNKTQLDLETLKSKIVPNTMMWLLEAIDRTKNKYGINMYVNRPKSTFQMEIVGQGFDVSDLNRGNITPQEIICSDYPIRESWNNEWWKYMSFKFKSQSEYEKDKLIRLNKLRAFGLNVNDTIFKEHYKYLPYEKVEELLYLIKNIDSFWDKSDEYVVSASINEDNFLVFWDVQTPKNKERILRV